MTNLKQFKKGDRVCWRSTDEEGNVTLKHGTITKGGKNIVATMDGGKYEVKGKPTQFRYSDKPIPKDPTSPMDDYSVTKYKEIPEMSDETTAYVATISYKGKPVLQAQNQGCGGDTMLHLIANEPLTVSSSIDMFIKAAKAWATQFGQTKPFEAYDEWIDWYVNYRPFAVTAAAYNEDIEKALWKLFIQGQMEVTNL